jgi:soluble lytic murein transglycosylase-like protein
MRIPRFGLVRWVALAALCLAAPAEAQVFRVEDPDGVVHYTNTPCDPRYMRLAPGACPPPATSVTESSGAAPFSREIESSAARYGVDRRLVEAVMRVESGGNPRAVSPKGALGLMQLMPERAATLGVAEPFDPAANLDGGVRHLRELLVRYEGNLHLVLAAYNAGVEAVRTHDGIPPYRETQEYVRKVLALYGDGSPGVIVKPPARRPARASRL